MNAEEEECVYNLVEIPEEKMARPPRYRSKYPHNTPPTGSTFIPNNTTKPGVLNLSGSFEDPDKVGGSLKIKRPHATMGRVVKNTIRTEEFTQSRSGEPKLPKPKRFQYKTAVLGERRPPVPKRDEKPIMGLKSNKNFVVTNAVENILSLTQKRRGRAMNWTQREEFGKVPKYLEGIKKEISAEYTYIEQLQDRERGTEKVI